MEFDFQTAAALSVTLFAASTGAARLAVRALLRAVAGAPGRRLAGPAQIGFGAGAVASVLLAAILWDGAAALAVAVGFVLLLLVIQDIAWRWLPHEWTGALAALGLISATFDGRVPDALIGAFLGSGVLAALRFWWLRRYGVEAIGLGDVALAAGLGLFVGATAISWVLLGASITGLVLEGVQRLWPRGDQPRKQGIAFGAHLCVVMVVASLSGLTA